MVDPKIPLCRKAVWSMRDTVEPRALQSIALAVAEARSVDQVLQRIVDGLAGQPGIAWTVHCVRPEAGATLDKGPGKDATSWWAEKK